MFCKKCGSKIQDDAKFCAICGQQISKDVENEVKLETLDMELSLI